ncbi:MAG: hypothetical protein AUG48_05960 [Actinobacteria bacterium 13_1_20CM_3_68_9]|nr:MAG: hypothetical protein AUG48_05960 [Actinobacteria bacterium 13_1_20CM_3_68_9]
MRPSQGLALQMAVAEAGEIAKRDLDFHSVPAEAARVADKGLPTVPLAPVSRITPLDSIHAPALAYNVASDSPTHPIASSRLAATKLRTRHQQTET